MKRPLLLASLCIVIIVAVGLETAERAQGRFDNGAGELTASEPLLVTGQIYQKEEQTIYLKSVALANESIMIQPVEDRILLNAISANHSIGNLICETDMEPELPLGCWVTVQGEFIPCSHASNPGEFDGAIYYRTLGIGGKLREATVLAQGEAYWPLGEWLYQCKRAWKGRLYQIFPEKEAAVMSALLLGDKSEMDSEMKALYKRNGILHIFSISSLHITIIGMGIYQFLRKVGIHRLPSAAAGSILLLLYGCMTGFSVSAYRAIGMYLIRMLGEVTGRTYDMMTALGVMAAIMVVQNPYCLQSGGFLLSFASVLGIGVIYPAFKPEKMRSMRKHHEKGIWRLREWCKQGCHKLKEAAAAGVSITLTTLPVQLYLYYEIPIYAIFLNLLVIPLLKPMMISGIMTLLPGLGRLRFIAQSILICYEILCGCFNRFPMHTWNPGCPDIWQIVVYYTLLSTAAALRYREKKKEKCCDGIYINFGNSTEYGWHRKNTIRMESGNKKAVFHKIQHVKEGNNNKEVYNKKRKTRITYLSVAIICLSILVFDMRLQNRESAVFLDVGQGDCILVRTASGQTYLFDCGSSSRKGVGKYILIPYLKYQGIHTIDAVFLSHPDEDHINGALELLESGWREGIDVKQVLLPAIEEKAREEQFGKLCQGVKEASQQGDEVLVGYLAANDTWKCDNTVFTCLHPEAGYRGEHSNEYSECIYIEFPEWTLLLTGDVEGRGEEALLEALAARGIEEITVLKAAHHGSRNSSSEAFLRQVSPRLTVISSGRKNRYGHPHQEMMERVEETKSYVMLTAEEGAITVTFRNGNLRVKSVWP